MKLKTDRFFAGVLPSYLQVSKLTLFDPNLKLSQPLFGGELRVGVGEPFQNFLWNWTPMTSALNVVECGSDLRMIVNYLAIFSGSGGFLSLRPMKNQHLSSVGIHAVSMCLSGALMVTGKQSAPQSRPGGIWLTWVHSVGRWWR